MPASPVAMLYLHGFLTNTLPMIIAGLQYLHHSSTLSSRMMPNPNSLLSLILSPGALQCYLISGADTPFLSLRLLPWNPCVGWAWTADWQHWDTLRPSCLNFRPLPASDPGPLKGCPGMQCLQLRAVHIATWVEGVMPKQTSRLRCPWE
jgi:hypothetical protein